LAVVFVNLKPCVVSLEVDTTPMEVSAFLFSGLPSIADLPVAIVAEKSIRKMEDSIRVGL
jgi:hypothetical protein